MTTPHVFGVVNGTRTEQGERVTNAQINTYADAITELQGSDTQLNTALSGKASGAALTAHASNTNNPHVVTAAQVGALTTVQANALYKPLAYQPTVANISDSTAPGRALLTSADAPAQRTSLGLGGAAVLNVGTVAGTVVAGDDARFAAALTQATGDARYGQLAAANVRTVTDAATGSGTTVETFRHRSTGTPAAGFASRYLYQLSSSTTQDRDAVAIVKGWTVATDGTRTSYWAVETVSAGGGLAERMRLTDAALTVNSGLSLNNTPVLSTGLATILGGQVDVSGLTGDAGYSGLDFAVNGTRSGTGSSYLMRFRRDSVDVLTLSSIGEMRHKALGLTGFSSYQYDGINTSASYGWFRATNSQTGVSLRNALPTDDGSGIGFRLSVTTNSAYTGVANLKTKVLAVGNGQTGGGATYRESPFYVCADGSLAFTAPPTAPADALLQPGQVSAWLDETNNFLNFKCRLSNGTYKSASIALV